MVCERRNALQWCGSDFGFGFGTFSESSLRSFSAMDYPRNNWGNFDNNYGGGGGYGNGGGGGYGKGGYGKGGGKDGGGKGGGGKGGGYGRDGGRGGGKGGGDCT